MVSRGIGWFPLFTTRPGTPTTVELEDFFKDHTARSDFRIFPYGKGTKHLRARAYHYIIPHGRMALSVLLTRSAQGNALIKSYVVPYYGCFSYDNSIPVINEKPFSDLCSRMYFDSRFAHAPLRDPPPGQEKMTGSVQSVRRR